MAAHAKRTLALALVCCLVVGTAASSEEDCNCEALRQEISQLQAEVRTLRASSPATTPPRRMGDQACGVLHLKWDAQVQVSAELGCHTVSGLFLEGSSVTSVTGLENLAVQGHLRIARTNLRSVRGMANITAKSLFIEHNPALESLAGLERLTSLWHLTITNNSNLSSLSGLQSVHAIEHMWVEANTELKSLAGLESLASVGGLLSIKHNPSLSSLSSTWQIKTVGKLEIYDNRKLLSLAGLEHLTSVTAPLHIGDAPSLTSLLGLRSLQHASQSVSIINTGLASLAGLDNLTYVGQHVQIQSNPILVSLTGLGSLQSAGTLGISDNAVLKSLSGLETLARVVGSITVQRNPQLQSLSLPRIQTTAGSVTISENDWLGSLGLGNLTVVGEDLHIHGNSALHSFDLGSLESVKLELKISSQRLLTSLRGLESLTSVGALVLLDNTWLSSLASLRGLVHAWNGITIVNCGLQSLEGLGSLYRASQLIMQTSELGGRLARGARMGTLGGPFAPKAVIGRADFAEGLWPRCVSPHERAVVVSALESVEESVVPNATLQQWHENHCTRWVPQAVVTCTKGQPCSFPFLNITPTQSVFVSLPSEGCGACSHRPYWTAQAGGLVDLGYALGDAEAGLRSICRCHFPLQGAGPVAQLRLRGPGPSKAAVCSRGHNCTLEVDGVALEPTDHMVLMSSCASGDPLRSIAASMVAENVYLLHDPAEWYAAEPGRYEVCWRAPCTSTEDGPTCPAPEDRYFHAGTVELFGVYSRNYALVLGETLSVLNSGFGVEDGDWMRLRHDCGKANEDGLDGDSLEARSSGLVFNFGSITKDRLRAGRHSLCWCQPRNGVACNVEAHFMAVSGAVQVLCPPGEELTSSLECRQCPAGKQRIEGGPQSCFECPAGQFSRDGDQCEACQDGTVAEQVGSSACVACRAWERAEAEAVGCVVDPPMVVLLALFSLLVGAFCAMLVQVVGRRLEIVDVCLEDNCRTIVTIFGPHRLSDFGRGSFPVAFHGTGHPGLRSPFRARVRDAARLELLTAEEQPVKSNLDTSMGTLTVVFPHDYFHQRWLLPAVLSLSLLLVAIAAMGGLILALELQGVALSLGAAVALACTAASVAVRLWPRPTPLRRRLLEFERLHLPKLDRLSLTRDKGPERAISLGKLNRLLNFFHDFIQVRTAYYLDQNVLQPLTKAEKLSYAERAGAGRVEWFVSHFWGTAFVHFCAALREHAKLVGGEEDTTDSEVLYWICFCSNNQHTIEDELGDSWKDSSFYIALKSGYCQGTCMVLDEKALPLTRVWCIFELLQTYKMERSQESFQGLFMCSSSGVLNTGNGSVDVAMALARKVADMDLATARASNAGDELMIRDLVVKEMGTFGALNAFIHGEVRNMLVRARGSSRQHFDDVIAILEETTLEETSLGAV